MTPADKLRLAGVIYQPYPAHKAGILSLNKNGDPRVAAMNNVIDR
jgi:hypothetical protein